MPQRQHSFIVKDAEPPPQPPEKTALNTPEDPPPQAAEPFVFKAGIQIGEYIVEKKIGQGGMGEVWSARHPKIGKRAAIKLLSRRLLTNKKAVIRFANEALAVNEIQHRHIIDIFSFGELPDKTPYFIMEYLSGKSTSPESLSPITVGEQKANEL
jgi:serine/threonine protein kinase